MKPLLEIAERALDQLERWQDTEDWDHWRQAVEVAIVQAESSNTLIESFQRGVMVLDDQWLSRMLQTMELLDELRPANQERHPMIDNNGATTDEQKIETFKLDPASRMPLPNLKPSKPSDFHPPGQSNALLLRQHTAKPSNARPF